jgi:hypothetical protein
MGGFILPLSQAKVKGVNLSCGVQLTTCLPVPCGVMVSLPHLGAHCLLTLSLSLSAPFLRSEDLKILCRLVMWKAEWSLRTFLKSRATLGQAWSVAPAPWSKMPATLEKAFIFIFDHFLQGLALCRKPFSWGEDPEHPSWREYYLCLPLCSFLTW